MSGWALDDDAIESVHVEWEQPAVASGAFRARHGLARPDVAGLYPGHPYAALSGFLLDLDTQQFLNGIVYLDVVVNRDSERRSIGSTSILVENPHNSTPPLAIIEAPRREQVVEGPFLMRGWIASPNGILGGVVTLMVNGEQLRVCDEAECAAITIPARYARPDLAPGKRRGSASGPLGFEAVVDPRGVLAPGMHRVGVEIVDGAGNSTLVQRQISYTGSAAAISPFGAVETPVAAAVVSASLSVAGWGLDDTRVTEATLVSSELAIRIPLDLGVLRPDVAASYPLLAPPLDSGFAAQIDGNDLGPGRHALIVRLVTSDGGAIDLPFGCTLPFAP